jgi:hypothetical protein
MGPPEDLVGHARAGDQLSAVVLDRRCVHTQAVFLIGHERVEVLVEIGHSVTVPSIGANGTNRDRGDLVSYAPCGSKCNK